MTFSRPSTPRSLRAAVLVAYIASGEQRLVREGEVAGDPLQEGLRMRNSGLVEHQGRPLFLTVQAPDVLEPEVELAGLNVAVSDVLNSGLGRTSTTEKRW